MGRVGVIAVLCAAASASARPPPGLRVDPEVVAHAERQVRHAAKVREVGATLSGVAAAIGGVVLLGSALQPIQVGPGSNEPSLAGFQTVPERLQQLASDNRERDRTIAAGLAFGAAGLFLGACVVSAIVDGGASEWLALQRAAEARALERTPADADRELLEAARVAQRTPAPPGRTLRPGATQAGRARVEPLSPFMR